ncbi:MAG: hypothetical protein ACRD3D_09595, partial [Terriglobia bacterium]
GAREAEQAYWELGYRGESRSIQSSDEVRRRRLVPMVLAEMRRRARVCDRSGHAGELSGVIPARPEAR